MSSYTDAVNIASIHLMTLGVVESDLKSVSHIHHGLDLARDLVAQALAELAVFVYGESQYTAGKSTAIRPKE